MLKSLIRKGLFDYLERHGYEVHVPTASQRANKKKFCDAEQHARRRYEAFDVQQKMELPRMLEEKYEHTAVLGTVRVYDAIAQLATVINPLEPELACLSQLTHELQLATAMERDGMSETLVLCALIRDLGTILLDTDEDPINVEAGGKKAPLRGEFGGGLYNCTFRWDHGDFVYLRLKNHVAPDVAWLLRHHSMDLAACEPYMNEEDRAYTQRLFIPFEHYDAYKDIYSLPSKRLVDYRAFLDEAFPREIFF